VGRQLKTGLDQVDGHAAGSLRGLGRRAERVFRIEREGGIGAETALQILAQRRSAGALGVHRETTEAGVAVGIRNPHPRITAEEHTDAATKLRLALVVERVVEAEAGRGAAGAVDRAVVADARIVLG